MADQIVHRTVRLRTSPTRTIRLQSGVPSIYMVSSTINQSTGELIITLNNGSTLNMGTVTNKMYKFVVTASAVAGATILSSASLSPYNYFLEVDGHSLIPDPANEDGYDWATSGLATLSTALKGGEQVIASVIQTNLYQTPVNVVSGTITANNVLAFGMSDLSTITAGTFSTLSDLDWGEIGGTLSDQTDLATILDSKLNHTGGTYSTLVENQDTTTYTITGADQTVTLGYVANSLTINATAATGTVTIEKGDGWVDGSFMNVTFEGSAIIAWGESWTALRNATQPAGNYTTWGEFEIYIKNAYEYIREVEAA